MAVEHNIELALFRKAEAIPGGYRIAWPNKPFTPKVEETYLRIDHFRNQTRRLFQNGADPHAHEGFLQITVVTPLNKGSPSAVDIAESVVEFFPADLTLFENSTKVTVTKKPDIMSPLKQDASWDVPVTVYYEAFG